jgi:hypothetical protein
MIPAKNLINPVPLEFGAADEFSQSSLKQKMTAVGANAQACLSRTRGKLR